MRVVIEAVGSTGGKPAVWFRHASGRGAGLWIPGRSPPRDGARGAGLSTAGTALDVELTLRRPMIEGRNARGIRAGQPRCSVEGSRVVFAFVIDGQDDDGMVYARLGPDSLTLVESDDRWRTGARVRVEMAMSDVEVWQVGA